MVTRALREARHEVDATGDGSAADERIAEGGLDVVVLDWMLPGMAGLDVCRRAPEGGSTAAIVMLTARDEVNDRVRGSSRGCGPLRVVRHRNAVQSSHGFEVTAMHQHMIGDDPTVYYVHFWRVGSPGDVAGGLRDALSHIHTVS